ncbi:CNT family concentrative nucleoside transporter [Pontibacter ummariensis]|uniref:Concentrative nucleoside transporter, CNT family n=1 Tax=Pontibacter ummariensis TaxID=1610492 RepID=A0A239DHC3_9BACT|nr:nucleoside transporter C-terminal domain-containing protein [Pontibacter ummariensis]PRY14403.1 CNT family concentrative nucleoside transporter [Pontibacter ummariensis]SNS31174.1 concentrative nucleoside transporter, CNT family [Pontibacter ummariensis]
MYDIFRGVIGLVALLAIAFLFSKNKKQIDWKLVGFGVFLQVLFGVLVTQVPLVADIFAAVSRGFVTFLDFSQAGAEFLFGPLANPENNGGLGYIFAFSVLPTIIFFSTVSSGLYYLGILQKIVWGIAWVMSKGMRLSGAESLSAAGNIFLGQTEAPLLVRPFIGTMTRSELMCLMTGGMATLAGGVLAAYVAFLGGDDPAQKAIFAAHLLTASIMNAPAGIVLAKILVPETEPDKIKTELEVNQEQLGVNLIDALSRGAADGLRLAANVGGMLLAFIAVIALVNYLLTDLIGDWTGLNAWVVASTEGSFDGFSLQYVLGQIFRIFAFIMGVPWVDTLEVGSLLGQKTAINEFVAYLSLAEMKTAELLTPKSIVMATYALCGFSNFSSIAIQIGGIGSMAPSQQGNLSKLGFLALLGASLACMMTATVAGMLYVL